MSLARIRRAQAPLSAITALAFVLSSSVPRGGVAAEAPPNETAAEVPSDGEESSAPLVSEAPSVPPPTASGSDDQASKSASDNGLAKNPAALDPTIPLGSGAWPGVAQPLSLPSGADKSGVTSQSASMPKGSGTVQGMGESFSAQLSTGIATMSIPFALSTARGPAQPSLGLAYSSAAGSGLAGIGWDVSAPFIARQTDRGTPKYQDGASWHPERDRFVFNGGQELVPICVVGDPSFGCTERLQSDDESGEEALPAWAGTGWEYFRARVEGSFLRFFWSQDHQTWRVQDKSGVTLELGVPLDDPAYTDALERSPFDPLEPNKPRDVYRWHLVRQYGPHGNANPATGVPQPANLIAYRYQQDAGRAYLTDIYDTPPAAGAEPASLEAFAHRTRLSWSSRPDPTTSYRSGWRIDQRLRLSSVEVSSKTFLDGSGTFKRVRRYTLGYDDSFHVSLLSTIETEGRCAGGEEAAVASGLTQPCKKLPPIQLGYSHVKATPGALGFEDFAEDVRTLGDSPKYSVDELLTDLFDVNADALPDVIVTAPGLFNGKHGLFLSGATGAATNPLGIGFKASTIVVSPNGVPPGTDENILKLSNSNVTPLDLDGDGRSDLVHMPLAKKYEIFSPVLAGSQWTWAGRSIQTASEQDVKIDFTNDVAKIRVFDVDFDGLVDVVVTTGTEIETFFSLGRYPHQDGQFGKAKRTGPATSTAWNDPVTACLPWSATPIQFSDPDVFLGDMNGDGITDIARVRSGDIRYWPGRGNGFWGTGKRDDCPSGTYGQDRHVAMSTSPNFGAVGGGKLLLDDVNGDGLADLVEIRFNAVDIYLNVNGVGWTDRHIIYNTPPKQAPNDRVRLVDVDGSGTRDVLWGDGYDYKYIDLQGGQRPWLLTSVSNGLGKTTSVGYSTSTAEMLAAEAGVEPWKSKSPLVAHVVKKVTESDGLGGSYATEYQYADPVYDGQQRELRGFGRVSSRRVGDGNSPTDVTETRFMLGECLDEQADAVDACSLPERWRDNPREALKGLPYLTERRDESGRYLSTEHSLYRLRELYRGLDGRSVRHAFAEQVDRLLYDTGAAQASGPVSTKNLPRVRREVPNDIAPTVDDTSTPVPIRATAGTAELASLIVVDVFGSRKLLTSLGCVGGSACPTPDEEIIEHTLTVRVPGDSTGWLWRVKRSYVTGAGTYSSPRRDTTRHHDANGDVIAIEAALSGVVELDRFHEEGKLVGALPAAASSNGTISVVVNTYDGFGNLVYSAAPTGVPDDERCRTIGYDVSFSQLPVSETFFPKGCSSFGMPIAAEYDRGLGLVTAFFDWNDQPSAIGYDELGRLQAITRPDPEGGPGTTPSVLIDYALPPDLGKPYSAVRTRTQDGPDATTVTYLESVTFVDGLGRTRAILSEADPTAGDEGTWIVSGLVDFDSKGALRRKYQEHYSSSAWQAFSLVTPPALPSARQRYDAFGRTVQSFDLDGTLTLKTVYQALSRDLFDAADIGPGPHQGTPLTELNDGHGRLVKSTERFRENGALVSVETRTRYLPTGEPESIVRSKLGSGESVSRWMRYDSFGRMVANVEPNTTQGYTYDPDADLAPAKGIKTWRYAYNDQGDLVATSDARGCGVSFYYDGAGRLRGEDYSPCLESHEDYSEPKLATFEGFEALYQYDEAPDSPAAGHDPPPGFMVGAGRGRLVARWDRGTATWFHFDGLGRVTEQATRITKPSSAAAGGPGSVSRYAPRWYHRKTVFDAADRLRVATTGATVESTQGLLEPLTNSTSAVTTTYSARGTVRAAGGSYKTLVASVDRAADGLINEIVYGDLASTRTGFTYDERRRLSSVQTYRGPPGAWTAPPSNYFPAPFFNANHQPAFQLLLQDEDISYDVVNNPVEIRDWRIADEWPAASKPVTRKIQYDDLYRVRRIDYQYASGDDAWKSPFEAENDGNVDPRRAKPSPHVSFDRRLLWQSYKYDWRGNTLSTDDDAHGFYDRSLGTITNDAAKPYQLASADNAALGGARTGRLETAYDAAGNLVRLHVRRDGPCLPAGGQCSQIFAYDWDEVGRLAKAQRWDVPAAALGSVSGSAPKQAAKVTLEYTYDASDERVLKTARGLGPDAHTAYIFESLELRRAGWVATKPAKGGGPAVFDYELAEHTEVPYLFANGVRLARVVYEPPSDDVPSIAAGHTHVFFDLGDRLGSTSVVLDQATSELVERATYETYGAKESDYRPERWDAFREDHGFTGKEDDVEIGLQYFGKRYYSPPLLRWVSADPQAIHGTPERAFPIASANCYSYAAGDPLRYVDPKGLSLVAAGASGFLIGATVEFGRQVIEGEEIDPEAMFVAGAAGAVGAMTGYATTSGMAAGGASPLASVSTGGFLSGVSREFTIQRAYERPVDKDAGLALLAAGGSGAVSSLASYGITTTSNRLAEKWNASALRDEYFLAGDPGVSAATYDYEEYERVTAVRQSLREKGWTVWERGESPGRLGGDPETVQAFKPWSQGTTHGDTFVVDVSRRAWPDWSNPLQLMVIQPTKAVLTETLVSKLYANPTVASRAKGWE